MIDLLAKICNHLTAYILRINFNKRTSRNLQKITRITKLTFYRISEHFSSQNVANFSAVFEIFDDGLKVKNLEKLAPSLPANWLRAACPYLEIN